MDDKESERLMDEKWNNDWCASLEIFWKNTLFHQEERLRPIIEKLGLAVIPIAILPFEQYIYAKYVSIPPQDPGYNLLRETKMLVDVKRPDDISKKTPIAPGTYKSICLEAPYVWQKFSIFQKDIPKEEKKKIDRDFYKAEEKLVQFKIKKILYKIKKNKYENEIKGHYLIPLYFGTIPAYCLMFLTNTITPDIFNARYLRETFDMVGKIGESILNNNFIRLWDDFCENYKEIGGLDKRKKVFNILEKRLLGKYPMRKYSSWIHSLPGHWIHENKGQEIITKDFIDKWEKIKDRLIQGEKWYERHIKELMDMADKNKLFVLGVGSHDINNKNDLKSFRIKINKEKKLVKELKELKWFKNIINILIEGDLPDAQLAFYKLKSILNKTDYKDKSISAGFIYEWPRICEKSSIYNLFNRKTKKTTHFYNAAVCNYNPFSYVKVFYNFVNAFNTQKSKHPCKIKQIQIVNKDINKSTVIEIMCELSKEFPSDLVTLLSNSAKRSMILKNDGSKKSTSFFLYKLIETCDYEFINNKEKKILKFRLVSR